TALVIQSLPTITTFQKGGTFSSDGLVVYKKLVGYGDRLFPAAGEFNISAVDMQAVGSQVVTLTSTKTTTVTATFDINIVDTTGATITGIALNQSSTQQKEFYVGETFNANGLRVDKTMSNNVAVGLTSAEYVIDSALFDTATVGTYSIKIKLNGSELVVAYDVIVKAVDFDGLYYVTEEDVAHGLAAQAYALKIENGKYSAMYEPVGGTFAPLKPYVIARNENGQVQIDAWTYDSVAKTFTNATDGVAKLLRPTDILITIEHSTYKGFILVANENGCVEQKFIDGLGHVGVFYMDANKQTKLTPSTKFTQSTTIYLIGPDVDYTGKPFIGEYYTPFNNQLVLKVGAKQMEMEGMVVDYIAIESNGIWILDVPTMGGKMMFNPVTKQMEMDGNTPLKMLDRTTQAIVTFTSTNGNVTPQFLGKRVVTKGESLPALVKGQYNYIKYTFATYNGAAITADITIDLTAAEDVNVSNAISGKFGTFANYVVFDEQTETFAISKKGVQVATGAFVFVDKIGDKYIFSLTIGAQNVTVEIIVANNERILTIPSGDYKGEYYTNTSFFDGTEPFVDTFVFGTSPLTKTITIYTGGNMEIDGQYCSLNKVVATATGYTLSVEQPGQTGSTIFDVEYVTATQSLVYNGETYKGSMCNGKAFVGKFYCDTMIVEIKTNGAIDFITGAKFDPQTMAQSVSEPNAGKITITTQGNETLVY
ncbi:MAG: bacterial Ig-like domain-containing protein, partial [Clostridia bacterium]